MIHDESHEENLARVALDAACAEDSASLEPVVRQVADCPGCRDSLVMFIEELTTVGATSHGPRVQRLEMLLEHAAVLLQARAAATAGSRNEAQAEGERAGQAEDRGKGRGR